MGLFDLPAPLLSAADGLLGFLPPLLRLLLWALITGVLSMVCYWAFSTQDKISAAKSAALQARAALNSYAGDQFGEMWPLVNASLRTSLKHFWVVLGPAVLGSLPALTIIIWVSNQYGYVQPTPGESLGITTQPVIELQLSTATSTGYAVTYPASGESLSIRSEAGTPLLDLPLPTPTPVVHKHQWWNYLIGNPAGYLPATAATDEVRLDVRPQLFVTLGPDWLHTWEATYFLVLILSSLIIKVVFKID